MPKDKQVPPPNQPTFQIQNIYLKDVSFESVRTPGFFQQKKAWQPVINVNLNTKIDKLEDNVFDVTLTVTLDIKQDDKAVMLVEVKQAGVFVLKNFATDALNAALNGHCPTILFPYVRAVTTDMITKGGFPAIMLDPVNFDAIYYEQQKRQSANTKNSKQNAPTTKTKQ
ncbi:MAG: protein-export chaperone SecB [Gammaproteobacteria bacterium]|nr:MAG: protein-export chaperone SecB [Gammaproteobacteria bacterium]